MTKLGLTMMLTYWALIIFMLIFCFSKVIRSDRKKRK